jgi:Ca2+-binding RTX toxin-like protein
MTADRVKGFAVVETLEERRLFSADLLGDVVCVSGTRGADVIHVGVRTVTGADDVPSEQIYVDVNGEVSGFRLIDVGRILVKADGNADRVRIDDAQGKLPRVGVVPDAGGTATLARGVLNVEGTRRGDVIQLFRDARRGGNYVVNVNGKVSTFALASVSRILVFGNRQDDTVLVGQSGARFGSDVIVVAGDGDDRITTGAGNDTVYGGFGKDTLSGSDGNDQFWAGGEAVVDGGAGNDSLTDYFSGAEFTGGAGRDTFTGAGRTELVRQMFTDFDAAEDRAWVFPPS